MEASSTVTVLFCDLVGSTALLSSLSAEDGDDLRRSCFDALRRPVVAHGGTEVKNLGDGLMVVFSSASQAVACGVGMQRQLAALRARGGSAAKVALRVGISSGEATQEQGDWFGTPVIEAARLCAAADSGQVLVAEIVRMLCGSHGGHAFSAAAAYELKGLPQPVQACAVTWEQGTAPTPQLPSALELPSGTPFVGRAHERGRLRALWKQAKDDERLGVALLAGEPGAGKTRLAAEIAGEAAASGGRVLFGRCDEELGLPYQPFVEALETFWDTTPDSELLGPYGGELCRLLPRLTVEAGLQAPLRSDPETEQYRLFQAVAGWLSTIATDQPALLVLDDLHWAGKPTLLLLRHVIRQASSARLLIVGTYRDTDLDRMHPLAAVLADLRRDERVERLPVGGLDVGEVAEYAESATGHALDRAAQALAEAVHRETAGNPFFVGEVLRHLTETGVLWIDGGTWTSDRAVEEAGIPEGVREVVGRRVSRLGAEADVVLRAAAVAGQRFGFAELCRLHGDVAQTEEVIEQALRAQLIREVAGPRPSYAFTHALVRATLYEELSTLRRARLHRAVAEAIEAESAGKLDDRAAELAHHWLEAASTGSLDRALHWTSLAAEQAMQALAWDQAAHWYERALELHDATDAQDPLAHARLLLRLGEARRGAGEPGARQTLLEAAREALDAGDHALCARALLAGSRTIPEAGRVDREIIGLIEAALAAHGDDAGAVRAQLLALLSVELFYEPRDTARRFAMVEESVAIARRVGDPLLLEETLRMYLTNAPPLERHQALGEATDELGALVPQLTDPRRVVMNHVTRWLSLMQLGRVEDARGLLPEAAKLADELGEPGLRWHLTHLQVTNASVFDGIEETGRLLERAIELGRATGQRDLDEWVEAQAIPLTVDAGGWDHLVPELPPGGRTHNYLPVHRLMIAGRLARDGDEAGARRLMEQSLEQGLPQDASVLFTARVLTDVIVRLRAVDLAPLVRDLLAPHAGRLCMAPLACPGTVADILGALAHLLGDLDSAAGHYAASVDTCDRIGSRRWAAHARRRLAGVLLDRDGGAAADHARELLATALTDAKDLGMDRFAERVERGLRRADTIS